MFSSAIGLRALEQKAEKRATRGFPIRKGRRTPIALKAEWLFLSVSCFCEEKVGQGHKVGPNGLVHLFLEVVRQFRYQKDCLNLEKTRKKIRTQIKWTEFP